MEKVINGKTYELVSIDFHKTRESNNFNNCCNGCVFDNENDSCHLECSEDDNLDKVWKLKEE